MAEDVSTLTGYLAAATHDVAEFERKITPHLVYMWRPVKTVTGVWTRGYVYRVYLPYAKYVSNDGYGGDYIPRYLRRYSLTKDDPIFLASLAENEIINEYLAGENLEDMLCNIDSEKLQIKHIYGDVYELTFLARLEHHTWDPLIRLFIKSGNVLSMGKWHVTSDSGTTTSRKVNVLIKSTESLIQIKLLCA